MSLRRGGRDRTVARTCRATGETSSSHRQNRWSARSYNRQNREVDRRRNGGGQARSSGEAVTSAEPRGPAAHNVGINKGGRGEMIKASSSLQGLRRRLHLSGTGWSRGHGS